jgi:hypothetical protein
MNSYIEPGMLYKRSYVYLCISRDDEYTTLLSVEITFKTQYCVKFSNKLVDESLYRHNIPIRQISSPNGTRTSET